MTPTSKDEIIDAILKREGGFTDHPTDHGGPTNYGITQATLSKYLKRPATIKDVQNLSQETARAIYLDQYVYLPGYVAIASLDLLGVVVDTAVNHGPTAATKMLQRVLGAKDDGFFGALTQAAANAGEGIVLARRLLAERCRVYGRIITKDPSQAVFASGWANRIAEQMDQLA